MKTLVQINFIPQLFAGLILILISSTGFACNYEQKPQCEHRFVIVETQFEINGRETLGSTRSEFMTEDQISVYIHDVLIEKGINYYQFVSYEKVITLKSDEIVYEKLIFSTTDLIYVLYFDFNGYLIMERKWPKGLNAISI